ncbi:MAG: hypothetical protein MJ109_00580 [Kiritimatiellae bacterium]|nr:hypothetical protein [Kiritimatiellia bacterium]
MATKRGQAMMELAIGMFVLVLVVMTLTNFTKCIVEGLDMEREMRADVGRRAQSNSIGPVSKSGAQEVEIESFAVEYIFGVDQVKMTESVTLPAMTGLKERVSP